MSLPCRPRLIAYLFAVCCALIAFVARAQAQLPKSPEEIEADIVGGQTVDAPTTVTPAKAKPATAGQVQGPDQQELETPPVATDVKEVSAPSAPVSSTPEPIVKTPNVELWPVPSPTAREQVAPVTDTGCDAHCQAIHAELTELAAEKEGNTVVLPILGMVAGYGGAVLLTSATIDNSIGKDGARIAGLGIGAAAMLGVGIASHVWLRSRVDRRRSIQRRMTALLFEKGMSFGTLESRQQVRARMVRAAAIDEELAVLRGNYARYSLTAPIVMMSAGFAASVPLVAFGLVALAFGAQGEPFILGGIVSAGVGVGGALWLGHRKRLRKPIGARIRQLQDEQRLLVPVSFDVQLGQQSAKLVLQWTF